MKKLLLALVLTACSGTAASDPPRGASEPAPGAPATSDTTTPPPPPATAETPTSCAGREALAGDLVWSVRGRTVLVHMPASYDATRPLPVVLNFHGYTNSATYQATYSGMPAKADAAGFIAVHPEGTGSLKSWNAGACCGDAVDEDVDDVGFVRAILDELASKACVDGRRVFATGFSNGGFFAHRLACELSDRIAAVASVSGVMGMKACTPPRAVPVLQFHGTSDWVVPYDGDASWGFASVASTVDGWAVRDGCKDAGRTLLVQGAVTCTTREACNEGSEVTLCRVQGGGHTWPGAAHEPGGGATNEDIRATDAIWSFFERHAMP